LALLALFISLPAVLRATVLLPIEFRELVTVSTVIAHGRVSDVRANWVDGRRAVETFVTVDVSDYLKGNAGPSLVVRVPGGQLGRYRTVFVGAPEFARGDEVVLFLKGSPRSFKTIVGLSQGAYRVVVDSRTGQPVVTTPIVMSLAGDQTAPVSPVTIVRGDPARRPLPIDAFRDAVRQVIAQGSR
jgi:hypothetical protein